MRIGIGYDIHRLEQGRRMVLGGVEIPFDKGPLGHSDGDALLHAICDAILGSLSLGDIGTLFPDTDPRYKDIASSKLLAEAGRLAGDRGYEVSNLDCVVIAERPKIASHRGQIAGNISRVLGIEEAAVSVKGKTAEGTGAIGEGAAVAAYAVALLRKKEKEKP